MYFPSCLKWLWKKERRETAIKVIISVPQNSYFFQFFPYEISKFVHEIFGQIISYLSIYLYKTRCLDLLHLLRCDEEFVLANQLILF